jgi:hypothetical protein
MEQYYLRVRGQVSGPYTVADLHNLRLRGQFGRFHEVSRDQVRWAPAGSVAALFPSGPNPIAPPEAPPLDTTAEWYYLDRDNQQQGPASLEQLQALLDAGQLDAGAYVCKLGMPEWVPLSSLPQMLPPEAGGGPSATGAPRRALLVGIVAALLIGVVAVVVSGYLAVDSFTAGETALGWVYLVVLLAAAALTGVGAWFLALDYLKKLGP